MSKSAKRRFCPVVGREIFSAECGENRGSRYACPADCPYSPFAPANYDQLLDLEELVDRKTLEWWFDTAPDRGLIQAGMEAARKNHSPHALHAFLAREIFFRRDASGRTCARRWEDAGFPGLRNDERVLLRAKLQVRVTLLEVRRVLDAERTEAVDLLQPTGTPLLILDRGLARRAVRFAPFVGWM